VRELADAEHLAGFGIHAAPVRFERKKIADHANQLVATIRANLTKTLERAGVTILRGQGRLEGPQRVGVRELSGVDRVLTARDVILATGSDPFVPPGIETDGRSVFTSDEAVNLEWLPRWIAIIGSGYIGLEFADVYTALGCEVTMIEALDRVMPTFDPDIAKIAARKLIDGRDIDARSGVLAKSIQPGSPVQIELVDMKTREPVETLEVDAVLVATGRVPSSKHLNLESVGVETNRGFIPVDDSMRVLVNGAPQAHLWAVGDVTGKLMLAHTAAAQGSVAVDNILGHPRQIDYRSIPAATFTHPEISSVGLSEADAKELAGEEGFELGTVRSYFKANSKALAELESDGLMKLLFNKTSGEVLGAHIYGLHAADLIQEIANAVSRRQSVTQLANEVHTHPTLSEVVEVAYKQAASAVGA
jgi:dihydrolipoamide dehydrogenase